MIDPASTALPESDDLLSGTTEPAEQLDVQTIESEWISREPRETTRGPGFAEAIAWIFGFFALELGGSVVWLVGLQIWWAASGRGFVSGGAELQGAMQPFMIWMLGSIKLAEVVVVVAAMRLRFGPGTFRTAGFKTFSLPHAVLACVAVMPSMALSSQLHIAATAGWERLSREVPLIDRLDLEEMSSMIAVQEMAKTVPLWALVLVIAVAPALNEELLFRATIGRGLQARYGIAAGVTLTSLLFAAVHLSPAHALALLPLAVLLQVSYYASRSFWIPVLVHFLNNASAVALMKATLGGVVDPTAVAVEAADPAFNIAVCITSGLCVALTVCVIYRSRIRWLSSEGRELRPAEANVLPSSDRALRSTVVWAKWPWMLAVALAYVGFFLAIPTLSDV